MCNCSESLKARQEVLKVEGFRLISKATILVNCRVNREFAFLEAVRGFHQPVIIQTTHGLDSQASSSSVLLNTINSLKVAVYLTIFVRWDEETWSKCESGKCELVLVFSGDHMVELFFSLQSWENSAKITNKVSSHTTHAVVELSIDNLNSYMSK